MNFGGRRTLRRRAARVVLLDARDRVLLIRASDPADRAAGGWWEIPGGGIDGGESSAEAATRELWEETGIRAEEISPCVWTHHASFDFAGMHFEQDEWVHVARCVTGEYRPGGLEAIEAQAFSGAEWIPVADLAGRVAAGERVIPHWLAEQVLAVLAAGLPDEPIDLGPS